MRKVPIMMTIEQYKVCDLEFVGTTEGNPYADVTVSATFTREDGTDQVVVGGFYRGGGSYGIRFMPRSTGVWNFSVESNDPMLSGTSGSIEVTPATAGNHGRVLRTTDVRSGNAFGASGESFTFSYEDGTPFLPFGTTCYAWTNQPEAVQDARDQLAPDHAGGGGTVQVARGKRPHRDSQRLRSRDPSGRGHDRHQRRQRHQRRVVVRL